MINMNADEASVWPSFSPYIYESNEISIQEKKIGVNNNRWANVELKLNLKKNDDEIPLFATNSSTFHAHNSNWISRINIFISFEMWIWKYFGTFCYSSWERIDLWGRKLLVVLYHCTCHRVQNFSTFFSSFDFDLVVSLSTKRWQIIRIIRKTFNGIERKYLKFAVRNSLAEFHWVIIIHFNIFYLPFSIISLFIIVHCSLTYSNNVSMST